MVRTPCACENVCQNCQNSCTGVNIFPYFLDARQGKGFEFSSNLGKGFEVQIKTLWIFGRFLVKTPKQIRL